MTDFRFSTEFNSTERSPMEPCTAPTADDFAVDNNTLIWVNIAGEMRVYSYDGVKVQYQVVQLSAKVDA